MHRIRKAERFIQQNSAGRIKLVRCGIIAAVLVCSGASYACLRSKYDPLARYPYGTREQREIMLRYLSDAEVDYLINMQVMPETVLPFIEQSGFNIENCLYYDAAMKARQAGPDVIVEFVNRYRGHFDLDSLSKLLAWMPYGDLIRYYDTQTSLPLVLEPQDPLLILDGTQTVFTYKPADLVQIQDQISLRQEAAQAWQNLEQAALKDGISLVPIAGYISYEQQKSDPDLPGYRQNPYGSREEQLGLSLRIEGFNEWNQTDSPALDQMEESFQNTASWLKENAWKYGWIVRYDQPETYQPFLIRYAGSELARMMHEENLTFEQAVEKEKKLQEENENAR